MEYQFHPAANVFPLSEGDEFVRLVESMRTHGYDPDHPIVLFEDEILDGRNRYRAAQEAGVGPVFTRWSNGGNPFKFAWKENAARRHLDPGQLAACYIVMLRGSDAWAAAKLERQATANAARSDAAKKQQRTELEDGWIGFASGHLPAGEQPENADPLDKEDVERRVVAIVGDNWAHVQAAREAGVSLRTMSRAFALEKGSPELIDQTAAGRITLNEAGRQRRAAELQTRLQALPQDKFRVIYADPPWSYGDKREEIGKWKGRELDYGPAEGHYPAMKLQDICALDVKSIAAADAALFLWVTSPLLLQGPEVMQSWGFEYKASFVWDKVAHNMGHYNSVRHELLLIGTRGSCLPENAQLFDSVQSIERSKEHSQKPEKFREIIDTLYPSGRRLELFARGRVPEGWTAWGADIGADSERE
jgi:N6-adenosine-specific RNA methylase IME4